jgi:hypothetical protein
VVLREQMLERDARVLQRVGMVDEEFGAKVGKHDGEELERALRLPPVGYLIRALEVDAACFRQLWVRPLLAAGATLEVALVCIAQSHFLPN